jgi:hypothetical protein
VFRDVFDNPAGQHRLASEPRYGKRSQIIQPTVDQALDCKDGFGTHATDSKVFITVSAAEIAPFRWEKNEVKTVTAERGHHLLLK